MPVPAVDHVWVITFRFEGLGMSTNVLPTRETVYETVARVMRSCGRCRPSRDASRAVKPAFQRVEERRSVTRRNVAR